MCRLLLCIVYLSIAHMGDTPCLIDCLTHSLPHLLPCLTHSLLTPLLHSFLIQSLPHSLASLTSLISFLIHSPVSLSPFLTYSPT